MSKESKRRYNYKKSWEHKIAKGHCPVCGMLLKSTFHIRCPFLDIEDKNNPI